MVASSAAFRRDFTILVVCPADNDKDTADYLKLAREIAVDNEENLRVHVLKCNYWLL